MVGVGVGVCWGGGGGLNGLSKSGPALDKIILYLEHLFNVFYLNKDNFNKIAQL